MAQRIVVAGGGYAGLAALAKLLNEPGARLTLVDSEPGHTLIPELPEALSPGKQVSRRIVSYDHLLKDARVSRIADAIVSINCAQRWLSLRSGEQVAFDWLILAVGTVPAFPAIAGLQKFALPLKSAKDTERIKRHVDKRANQAVVIVGGGLTGIEIAGVLVSRHRVSVVEGSTRLLPGLGPGLAAYAHRRLETAGVHFHLGSKLSEVTADHVIAGEHRLNYDVLIWAGGIEPPGWLRDTDLPLDSQGYPVADDTGEVADQIYVAGDLWRIRGYDKRWIPQTAQIAEQAGAYVGTVIGRRLYHDYPLPTFHPQLRGMLVALNPGKGVGWVYHGGLAVQGYSARWMKRMVFRQYRRGLARAFDHVWPN